MRVVKVHESVVSRLQNVNKACSGELFGVVQKDTFIVMGLIVKIEQDEQRISHTSFPMEIDMCGWFEINDGGLDEAETGKYLEEVDVTDNPVVIHVALNNSSSVKMYFYTNNRLEEANIETVNNPYINSHFLHARVKAQVKLGCEFSEIAIKDAFLDLRKQIASGQYVFHFDEYELYCPNANSITGPTSSNDLTIEELVSQTIGEQRPKKKLADLDELDVISVSMFKRLTREFGITYDNQHAPVIRFERRALTHINMVLNIDALALIHRKIKLTNLYTTFLESCIRNLRLYQAATLKRFHEAGDDAKAFATFNPRIFHFYPINMSHFVTKIYNFTQPDNNEEQSRRSLHSQLLLPMGKPEFRRSNQYLFRVDRQKDEPLLNPHDLVKPTNNGGVITTVHGRYHYYHYCQQGLSDDGWGCAYRSLQTLASWLRLQGHTEKPVPSLREIQQCLYDIGDKPASFVGSRQWIGSTEVSFVLETKLGIESVIINVSSGAELAEKGYDLQDHFERNGSPVMIGGGQLAHTILGVDFNADTNGIKFLILDPHYTGEEDMDFIIKKNWCAWKGVEFWDKKSYYNMCLPQVPKSI